jgi:menaquinone-specific isochorismate synthase
MEGTTVAVITQQELSSLLERGIRKSRHTTEKILVSQSIEIPSFDPFVFYLNGRKEYKGERIFWSDPRKDITLVGLGNIWEVTSSQHNFWNVEDRWKALLEQMIMENEFSHGQVSKQVGPTLLGGISFDPKNTQTKTWRNFPGTAFTLPKWVLTIQQNDVFLTLNILVDQDDDADCIFHSLEEEKKSLLKKSATLSCHSGQLLYEEIQPNRWISTVQRMTDEIKEGAFQKVVLARQLDVDSPESDFSVELIIKNLANQQPFSYIFAFEKGNDCFLGASPERLIKKSGNDLLSTCLAGTTRRGRTPEEDELLGSQLLNDHKNLEEHQLVVQMIKEAMEAVCKKITIPDSPTLYKVRDIQHLYTPVRGYGNSKVSLLAMVKKLHPTPALGGYPQKKAIEVIRTEEKMDRGWYSAPIGWLDFKGDGEFAVAIRSGLVSTKKAILFAGCGIVGDSDPISEYQETKMKFQPMLSALGGSKIE